MNLAEIRKKAEGEKKSSKAVEEPLPTEEEIASEANVPAPEQLTEEALISAEPAETEEYDFLAESLPDEDGALFQDEVFLNDEAFSKDELLLPDQLDNAVTKNIVSETPVDKVVLPKEAVLPAHVPVPTATADNSEAGPVRTGFDPIATILSGRLESVDSEEVSTFQQHYLSGDDVEEYLCFRVADEEYAMNIMSIKEIIKPREVTEVPRMPEFISGVISLRGVIIPVMDMRLRLSLPSGSKTGRERIIVLRAAEGFCGVLVDEVIQVARILKANIEGPPAVLEEIDRDFVIGLGHFDNRMLILLNIDTITDIDIRQ